MKNKTNISFINDLPAVFQRGIEKESLRVTRNGRIAETAHQKQLGSSFTSPYITTDYGEAMLEIVTPTFSDVDHLIEFLEQIHCFIYQHISQELLWNYSMPPVLPDENSILRASYGRSNAAEIKHIYDLGLRYRYGELSQVIAGIHYNFSLSDDFWSMYKKLAKTADKSPTEFVSESYLHLIRNFLRYLWIMPYLFGASPVIHKSFFRNSDIESLDKLNEETFFGVYATSLRMSNIGYPNNAYTSFNSLSEFIDDLEYAMKTPHPHYSKIGVLVEGKHRQLNTNILQKESEYYNVVRPKSGKSMTEAKKLGIEYVEVRTLDINPFEPTGISRDQILFMDMFLLFCLLEESPLLSQAEQNECIDKYNKVALLGRKHDLKLDHNGKEREFRELAFDLFAKIKDVADVLDQGDQGQGDQQYSQALSNQLDLIKNPDQTVSARILSDITNKKEPFAIFFMGISTLHKDALKDYEIPAEQLNHLSQIAKSSLQQQTDLEQAEKRTLEEFLSPYSKVH